MTDKNTYNDDLVGCNLPDSLRVNPFVVPQNFFKQQQEAIFNQVCVDLIFTLASANQATVPEGYFENLTSNIQARIAEENLKEKVKESGYVIPDHYFDELEHEIQSRISEEHINELVPTKTFDIPAGYFDDLSSSITAKIAEVNLKDKASTDGFVIPTEYFSSMEQNIATAIFIDQLSEKIKDTGFSTPAGYFSDFESRVLNKMKQNEDVDSTPVIQIPRRTNWIRYAAAILLFAGIGSYALINHNESTSNSTELFANAESENLDNVSDEEILNYLAQVSDDTELIQLTQFADEQFNEAINLDSQVENEDIEEYLNYLL